MLTVEVTLPGRLHADLAVAREVVALVGTNGSGKTTLLHAVAGLVAGRVGYDGEDWSARPPQQRRVGLVHQDHQLFPHLTALDNVAFGPRARGTSRRTAREEAAGLLERFGLGGLAGRRPHELSGGQAQRVALARALATGPDVLLLDEPFAALDVAVAQELRELLAEHLAGFPGPVLLATHDVLDVAALAGRVVVLDGQRVVQDGSPAAVAEVPGTSHAAQLLGINVVRGTAATGVVTTAADTLVAASHLDGPVVATFPPSAVTITRERPTGSARNAWLTRVVGLADLGDLVRLHLRSGTGLDLRADVTPGAVRSLRLAPGEEAWASVKATEVTVFSTARPGGVSPRSR